MTVDQALARRKPARQPKKAGSLSSSPLPRRFAHIAQAAGESLARLVEKGMDWKVRNQNERASTTRTGDQRANREERATTMATQQTATAGRALVSPSVILLFIWMIVPLVMTLYFSTLRYSLLDPENTGFVGLQNYTSFLSDPDFIAALINTLVLVISAWGSVTAQEFALPVALLMDQPVFGLNVRLRRSSLRSS
jgi:hypothetical protein